MPYRDNTSRDRRSLQSNRPMEIDLTDSDLFGNDAGEDEDPEILAAYFVESEAYKRFYDRGGKLHVARARKGMGKSALLAKFAYELRSKQSQPLVIQVTGADFVGFEGIEPHDFPGFINKWRQLLCSRINVELAKNIGFASSDTEITMVESAEVDGYKGRNLLGCLLARVGGKLPELEAGGAKVGGLTVSPVVAKNNFELLKRYADEATDASVWLLVDDIDSTFVDTPASRARTSSFFSACRSLVREIDGVRIRASVRTDVWTVVSKNEDLDKFEQYITDIVWSGEEFRTILSKRIFAYIKRKFPEFPGINSGDDDTIFDAIFVHRLNWGDKLVQPFHPIKILSAGRPRWMSQLCRLSGAAAKRHHRCRIGIQEINASMEQFGNYRLSDLYKEHSHQFSHLQKLIECFAGGFTIYETEAFLQRITEGYILKIGAAGIPELEGEKYISPLQLAHFLYKIGFIVARPASNEFVVYEDRPSLLRHDLSLDRTLRWEIQPSYRQALGIHNKQVRSEFEKRDRWRRKPRRYD